MLMMKAGVFRPEKLISLRKIESRYSEITASAEDLRIGAMTTLRQLEKSNEVRMYAPLVTQTLPTLSNVRVRNVATLGGHLAHGDPHMDLPPLFSVLGAKVMIAGTKGERACPVEALYAGYLETTIAPAEIITAVTVPAMGWRRAAYLKCTTRSADDWPALGVAVLLDGQRTDIVVSAATDKPTRLASAEAAEQLRIEGDLHGSAAYKKQLLRVYLKRAIDEARNARH